MMTCKSGFRNPTRRSVIMFMSFHLAVLDIPYVSVYQVFEGYNINVTRCNIPKNGSI